MRNSPNSAHVKQTAKFKKVQIDPLFLNFRPETAKTSLLTQDDTTHSPTKIQPYKQQISAQ